ncbi:MAG: hypothetical protein IT178_05245 [Acidobacteria bacterium]|nr:hypothetical protein [Acidobacteriota bacterium]
MPLTIVPYSTGHEPAVRAFNARLSDGGVSYQFPTSATNDGVGRAVVHRGFVAVDEDASVRGGYLVQEQQFWLNGAMRAVGYLHLPLSEGLVDPRYGALGVKLLTHAARRQPLLFGLGIGGRSETFARLVTALGWTLHDVPFLFRILRPARVAQGLSALRRTKARRVALTLAAGTGLASLGTRVLQTRWPRRSDGGHRFDAVHTFDGRADGVWARGRGPHQFVACRDDAALTELYADDARNYLRWTLEVDGRAVGWAVALDTQMTDHAYFGNLRLATIVDLFGEAAHAQTLVDETVRAIERRGPDLIVTNQSSGVWVAALRRAGFLAGPSNYLFAASPALRQALSVPDGDLRLFHLTRGDGDGPIHL